MTGKLMSIRRADVCSSCGVELPAGSSAYWLANERVVHCVGCEPSTPITPGGVPGGSARREYELRSTRELSKKVKAVADDAEWRSAIKEKRPVLGRVAAALTPKPVITPESQSTRAWKVGSEGEERVAEVMATVTGVATLHDRLVPGTRANIDHIVVGPSGVFVVDAKKYTGAIEVRDRGGLFRIDERLYVNNRDRTSKVEGVLGQLEVVRTALGDAFPNVEVQGVLCFIGCYWGMRARIKVVKGVTCLWPDALPGHVVATGPHAPHLEAIAAHLRQKLKPAL